MTNTTTMPAVPTGASSGTATVSITSNGVGAGSSTRTVIGSSAGALDRHLAGTDGRGGGPTCLLLFLGLLQILAELVEHVGRLLDQAAARGCGLQRADLGPDVLLVGGQVVGQLGKLAADQQAEAAEAGEGQEDRRQHRGHARQAPAGAGG